MRIKRIFFLTNTCFMTFGAIWKFLLLLDFNYLWGWGFSCRHVWKQLPCSDSLHSAAAACLLAPDGAQIQPHKQPPVTSQALTFPLQLVASRGHVSPGLDDLTPYKCWVWSRYRSMWAWGVSQCHAIKPPQMIWLSENVGRCQPINIQYLHQLIQILTTLPHYLHIIYTLSRYSR